MFDQWQQAFESNPMQAFHMLNANVPFMMGNMPKITQFLQSKGFNDFGSWRNSLDSASSSAYRPISADPNQQQQISNFGKTPYQHAQQAPVHSRTGGLDPNLNGHHGPGSGVAGTMGGGSGSGYGGPTPTSGIPMPKGPAYGGQMPMPGVNMPGNPIHGANVPGVNQPGNPIHGVGMPPPPAAMGGIHHLGSMGLPMNGSSGSSNWMPQASQNLHAGGWRSGWQQPQRPTLPQNPNQTNGFRFGAPPAATPYDAANNMRRANPPGRIFRNY